MGPSGPMGSISAPVGLWAHKLAQAIAVSKVNFQAIKANGLHESSGLTIPLYQAVDVLQSHGIAKKHPLRHAQHIDAKTGAKGPLALPVAVFGKAATITHLAAHLAILAVQGVNQCGQVVADAFVHIQHVFMQAAIVLNGAVAYGGHGNAAIGDAAMEIAQRGRHRALG